MIRRVIRLAVVATRCVSAWLTLLSALGITVCQSGLHLGAIAPLFRCGGSSSLALIAATTQFAGMVKLELCVTLPPVTPSPNAPVKVSYSAVMMIAPGAPEFASKQRPELVSAVTVGTNVSVQLAPRLSLKRTLPLGLNSGLVARTVTSMERCGSLSKASQKIRTLPPHALDTGVSI